jgi:hypothetical protein
MTDKKQLVLDILEQAYENNFIEFKYIRSWEEFQYYRRLKISTKLIIKTLKASSNKLFKKYCKAVILGISAVKHLLAYKQLLDIQAFYEKDLNTIQQMLDDYAEYLGQGNFWYSFLGGYRSTWDKYY